jgi:Predicted integral membrane protein
MSNFFSLDGKFHRFGTVLIEVVYIGLLWVIFSLPIITIGATTTALYYVCTKKHSGQDIYIFKNFLKSFKENFIKSTIIFLLLSLIGFFLWTNLHILRQIEMGWLGLPIKIALWFMLFQVALAVTNAFAILSRFEVTISTALKYGLFMGYRNFFTTISNWATLLAIFIVSMFFPMVFFIIGGIYVYYSSFSFVKLFRKHSEEFDSQIEEYEK